MATQTYHPCTPPIRSLVTG
ncbi:hypothetical protein QTG54_015425 [Skeletonema marinoi]|uniref:Uncharacterized protein n=1 Tax=Skeletonema marinoi TaxID=267567 RepID=A0AAD8XUI5_9STRA|nr:hypothetical protein QTG54_015425 [Skeletonema marinoi]